MLYRLWKIDSNQEKLQKARAHGKKVIYMSKTANKGIKKIMEIIKAYPDVIKFPYVKNWAEKIQSITGIILSKISNGALMNNNSTLRPDSSITVRFQTCDLRLG